MTQNNKIIHNKPNFNYIRSAIKGLIYEPKAPLIHLWKSQNVFVGIVSFFKFGFIVDFTFVTDLTGQNDKKIFSLNVKVAKIL